MISDTTDIFAVKHQVKDMNTEALLVLQRAVETELELRGAQSSFRIPDSGVSIGQGIYRIGEHIPPGTYAFHLPEFISRDSANCTYLFLFESMEAYRRHLEENEGSLGTIPTFSVYRNAPVSCLELTSGQVLAIEYNGVVISRFRLKL